MTLSEFLLSFVEGKHANVRALRYAMENNFDFSESKNILSRKRVLSSTIYRLKKQGFIAANESGVVKILERGRAHLAKLRKIKKFPKHSTSRLQKDKGKNIIVAFDIPQKYNRSRNWLRGELVVLGFEMLQKSVWIGYGPLPKKLLENLDELHILKHVHVFSIARHGTIDTYFRC